MAKYYKVYCQTFTTRDNKLRFLPHGDRYTPKTLRMPREERECLHNAGLMKEIESDYLELLIKAMRIALETDGFTLNTETNVETEWVSRDGRWRMKQSHRGKKPIWLIRRHSDDVPWSQLKDPRGLPKAGSSRRFQSRKAAALAADDARGLLGAIGDALGI